MRAWFAFRNPCGVRLAQREHLLRRRDGLRAQPPARDQVAVLVEHPVKVGQRFPVPAGAGRRLDWYGVALLAAGVIAAAFALLYRQLLRDGNDPLVATGLILLAIWPASCHWLARPHVFSFLLLILADAALRRHARDGNARRLVLVLTVIAVLWVNLHGGFLMLFFLLGVHLAGATLERNSGKLRQLALVTAICASATLLNPNGWRLPLHNLQFLSSPFMTGWIREFNSPDFHSVEARGLVVWLALVFLTLALRRPKLAPAEGLTLVVWTYFALYSRRNVPLLVLVSAPILAPVLSDWLHSRWSARLAEVNRTSHGWLTVTFAVVALAAWPRPIPPAEGWPVAAVNYIRAHPQQLQGPMFNQYLWGSYLLWELPERRVFVDSRQDFYGDRFIREFDGIYWLRDGWQESLAKYGVRWTLMPTGHRVNGALARLGWERAYEDGVATIYVRPR